LYWSLDILRAFHPSRRRSRPFRIYLTTGYDDFNHDELYHLSRDLVKRNVAHRAATAKGRGQGGPIPYNIGLPPGDGQHLIGIDGTDAHGDVGEALQ
jgi:hypothetical protein